jgi:hypothetical protein
MSCKSKHVYVLYKNVLIKKVSFVSSEVEAKKQARGDTALKTNILLYVLIK